MTHPDDAYKLAPLAGTAGDIHAGLKVLVEVSVPVHVWTAGLVLSTRTNGWRGLVLNFCMWLLRKTGHEVIEP